MTQLRTSVRMGARYRQRHQPRETRVHTPIPRFLLAVNRSAHRQADITTAERLTLPILKLGTFQILNCFNVADRFAYHCAVGIHDQVCSCIRISIANCNVD